MYKIAKMTFKPSGAGLEGVPDKVDEILGMRLCVLHNLHFYNELMEKIRDALDAGEFTQFRNHYSELLARRI